MDNPYFTFSAYRSLIAVDYQGRHYLFKPSKPFNSLVNIIISVNPVAESLTGWSEKEALGQPLESILPIIVRSAA